MTSSNKCGIKQSTTPPAQLKKGKFSSDVNIYIHRVIKRKYKFTNNKKNLKKSTEPK